MSLPSAWQLPLGFLGGKPILIELGLDQLTSDAGLLPIRQFDELLGLTGRFAAALDDPRHGFRHSFTEMTRSRIYGILAGYADQNDHDALRFDPIFKLVAPSQTIGRRARKSTDPVTVRERNFHPFLMAIARRAHRSVPGRVR